MRTSTISSRRSGRATLLPFVFFCLAAVFLTGCAQGKTPDSQAAQNGTMTVSFDFTKQTGYASNQFAVWIENGSDEYVKTLYATRFTAEGGYQKRPDALSVWVARASLADGEDVDAVTGATPKTGTLRYDWDLTNEQGERVPDGVYRYFVEGTLRWKNRVLYSGEIELNGAPAVSNAIAVYSFEASTESDALSEQSPEAGMIGAVSAAYTPPEQGE